MSNAKKQATPKKGNSGQFKKGNTVGKETRFSADNFFASKYKEEYCDLILSFFAEPDIEVIYEESYYQNGNMKSRKPIILPPKYPTFELFAASLGVVPDTLRNWCDTYPRFRLAYAQAKTLQLGIAKKNGVSKMYDGGFLKFVLVNDHGMTDKTNVEQSQEAPFEVNINVVNK